MTPLQAEMVDVQWDISRILPNGNSWDASISLTKKDRLTDQFSWERMEKDSAQVSRGLFLTAHWPWAEDLQKRAARDT